MRFAVVLVLVFVSVPAVARTEVIDEPPPVGGCLTGKTWEAVEQCLRAANQNVTTERSGPDWRLVFAETVRRPGERRSYRDRTLALYVKGGSAWQLGGHVPLGTVEVEVLSAGRVPVGKRTVFRIDLGQAVATSVLTADGTGTVAGLIRYNHSLYCNGTSPYCVDVFTSCEALVRGRAWYAFHGTMSLVDNDTAIEVRGDRSRSGAHCRLPAKQQLP